MTLLTFCFTFYSFLSLSRIKTHIISQPHGVFVCIANEFVNTNSRKLKFTFHIKSQQMIRERGNWKWELWVFFRLKFPKWGSKMIWDFKCLEFNEKNSHNFNSNFFFYETRFDSEFSLLWSMIQSINFSLKGQQKGMICAWIKCVSMWITAMTPYRNSWIEFIVPITETSSPLNISKNQHIAFDLKTELRNIYSNQLEFFFSFILGRTFVSQSSNAIR